MTNQLALSEEQTKAYRRFIRARDKVKLVKTKNNMGNPYIPHRDVIESIHVPGVNHPLFISNDDWIEYKEASSAWWSVEPRFREEERLRATRGDFDGEDNWEDPTEVEDMYQFFKESK